MKALIFLLAFLSFSVNAALLSEIPTDSIDTIFEKCFSDEECTAQIAPLVIRFSGMDDDLGNTLRNCLRNAGTMRVCESFYSRVLSDELTNLELKIGSKYGRACAMKVIGRAQKDVSAKARECARHAKSLGSGSDARLVAMSCNSDEDQAVLSTVRKLDVQTACNR